MVFLNRTILIFWPTAIETLSFHSHCSFCFFMAGLAPNLWWLSLIMMYCRTSNMSEILHIPVLDFWCCCISPFTVLFSYLITISSYSWVLVILWGDDLTRFQTRTHSDNYKLASICINKAVHRLLKYTSYHAYSLCISYELLSFCIQGHVRHLQNNAIQFPSLIPNIMIKIPLALIRLITVGPCWDNVCLYNSDKVALPFVASPLIFDSWHSNALLST